MVKTAAISNLAVSSVQDQLCKNLSDLHIITHNRLTQEQVGDFLRQFFKPYYVNQRVKLHHEFVFNHNTKDQIT